MESIAFVFTNISVSNKRTFGNSSRPITINFVKVPEKRDCCGYKDLWYGRCSMRFVCHPTCSHTSSQTLGTSSVCISNISCAVRDFNEKPSTAASRQYFGLSPKTTTTYAHFASPLLMEFAVSACSKRVIHVPHPPISSALGTSLENGSANWLLMVVDTVVVLQRVDDGGG